MCSCMRNLCILIALGMAITGCAHVTVYDKTLGVDKDYKSAKKIGIPVYRPVPHLLVQYKPGKDTNLDAKLIMLPDMSNPYYVVQHSGWGTAMASLTLENGILTSLNSNSDSKAPETMTAAAGLIKESAAAATGLLPLLAASATAESSSATTEDAEVEKAIDELIFGLCLQNRTGIKAAVSVDDVKLALKELRKADIKKGFEEVAVRLSSAETSLIEIADKLTDMYTVDREKILKAAKKINSIKIMFFKAEEPKKKTEEKPPINPDQFLEEYISEDPIVAAAAKAKITTVINEAIEMLSGIPLSLEGDVMKNIQDAVASVRKELSSIREKYIPEPSGTQFRLYRINLESSGVTHLQLVYP